MEYSTMGIPKYEYIVEPDRALEVLQELSNKETVAVDTETTGLDPYTSQLFLIQIGDGSNNYVFDVRDYTKFSTINASLFNDFWKNKSVCKVFQNALFDMKMLKIHGGVYVENVYDTMLAEQILTLGLPGIRYRLTDLMKKYLNINMPKEPRKTFGDPTLPLKGYQIEYAANDVVPLILLKDMQTPQLIEEDLMEVAKLEFDFLKPLCEMELNGVCFDQKKWDIIMKDIEAESIKLEQTVSSMLSSTDDQTTLFGTTTININSNQQLLTALKRYGLDKLESTDVKVLTNYKGLPIIDQLLDYRKYKKLCSTYGQSLLSKINPVTGRLHTGFRQMVSTGRLSSSKPNLQNIPNKQLYRTGFIAEEGYSLLTADQASAELRILANLSEDPMFLRAYREGLDLHTMTASAAFNIDYDKVTHAQRSKAKPLNFGLCVFEDTVLFSNTGQVTIKDSSIGGHVSHDVGLDEILGKKFMGTKEVFEIETKFGYTLEATDGHMIKVINSEGNYVDKKVKDIDTNKDCVCIKKGTNTFNKDLFKFDDFVVDKNTNYKEFDLPMVLDEDWASFLGLFVAEGHLHKSRGTKYDSIQFGMSNKERDIITKIDGLFSRLFNKYSMLNSGGFVHYSINSVKIARWLDSLFCFVEGKKTDTITIPICIKQSPVEVQKAFIRCLFEGDGTIWLKGNSSCVSYSSKSLNLVKDIQLILLNMGIVSSVNKVFDKRYPNEDYYVLNVVGHENKKLFMELIGFWTDHKNNKWVENASYSKSYFDLPCTKTRVSNIRKQLQAKSNKTEDEFSTVRYLYNRINVSPTCGIGSFYLEKLKEYDELIAFIHKNDIIPLSIKSIKPKGEKRVYDIEIKNHPYFLANGFVVHNCYGLSKFGLARDLKISDREAEEMIDNFFKQYKGVKLFLDSSAKMAIDKGYTVSISGRKRFYSLPPFYDPDFKKISASVQRRGKNMVIQASDADTIKKSMILLVDRLEESGLDAKLVLTVHDEVVVEVRNDQIEEAKPIVHGALIDGFGYYFNVVPMEVDVLTGPCWLKGSCENKVDGEECGGTTMVFVPDETLGTRLVCSKCGESMQ